MVPCGTINANTGAYKCTSKKKKINWTAHVKYVIMCNSKIKHKEMKENVELSV